MGNSIAPVSLQLNSLHPVPLPKLLLTRLPSVPALVLLLVMKSNLTVNAEMLSTHLETTSLLMKLSLLDPLLPEATLQIPHLSTNLDTPLLPVVLLINQLLTQLSKVDLTSTSQTLPQRHLLSETPVTSVTVITLTLVIVSSLRLQTLITKSELLTVSQELVMLSLLSLLVK